MPLQEGGTLGNGLYPASLDQYAGYSVKWDGEWQVTRNLPAIWGLPCGRFDPDLPAEWLPLR